MRVAVPALAAGGFALTVWIFYPGIMTYDAHYIYLDVGKGFYGDWQSPLMTALWRLIDPLAPGPACVFLLGAVLYWTAFAILAVALARVSAGAALALPVLALTPPAFVFLGVIWRDILLADAWLLAAVIAFVTARGRTAGRLAGGFVGLVLIAVGVLLRPNALLAAPFLVGLALWPRSFSLRRMALAYLPAAVLAYALVPLVYYGVFHAARQNPLQSLMVYDLGGITHFAKENQFPVAWSPEEEKLLEETCYSPEAWDVYWTRQPCLFVMARLERDKIFGSPAIASAWRQALARHPLAYLQHRGAVFWRFLTGSNIAMWTLDIADLQRPLFGDRRVFTTFRALYDVLQPTPLFRVAPWLLLCVALGAAAWRHRDTPAGAYGIGVCACAVVYVLTYAAVAVAVDFRYGLWAVVAGITALPVLFTARRHPTAAAP